MVGVGLLLAVGGALGVGGALFVLVTGVMAAVGRHRRNTEARLTLIAGVEAVVNTPSEQPQERGAALDRRITAMPLGARLKRDLRRAGLAWRVSDYMVIVGCCAALGGTMTWTVSRSTPAAILVALVGALLPVFIVRRRASRRAAALNSQVGDLLDLLASSMRAGFGFQQSMELASREQPDPIAAELRQTIRETSLGVSTEEALERLVTRTGDADLDLVIAAVLIQRRVGGNLASVLDNITQMIRDRARVRGEIQTLTAQARLSGKIVGFLPVGLAAAIYAMQPTYMDPLFHEPIGRLLLVTAIGLETVGFFIVNRIGSVDY
jgi:tight adherence protein B